ncbi:MAG: TldD/PmbA family protein [Planctomycetes bacterium]|nr:TldD/PmbA family protein [Planctomycetota bacterium]
MPELRDELLEQARRAVDLAERAGADDVVAGVGWVHGFEHEWREGKLEKVQETKSRGLGLSLYVDGRYSSHSTNDQDPTRLADFVAQAVALTRHLEPDPHRRITPPELYAGRSEVDLELVDPALLDLSRERRVEWCRELERAAQADDRVISVTAGVNDGHSVSARVSSNGFEGTSESTSLWLIGQVSAEDGEKRPEAYAYAGGAHLAGLPGASELGDDLLGRVRERIGAAKIPSLRTRLVLHSEAAASFLGRVLGALSGGAIQQKRSFLAGKLGERIGSELLTWTDDPLKPRGLGSRHFDGEGIAAKPLPILEQGVLRHYYVDTYYGNKLGWAPTTGGSSNVTWAHGPRDLEAIVADTQDGILLTTWLGGNANMTTGDFSFGFQGRRLSGGARAESLTEMNVSGNYRELLERLVEVGNDPRPWSRFAAPTLVFEDVQFSGL